MRFNSRAHGGRDPSLAHIGEQAVVSIHAPTGGATIRKLGVGMKEKSFNSRAHGGRDVKIDCHIQVP